MLAWRILSQHVVPSAEAKRSNSISRRQSHLHRRDERGRILTVVQPLYSELWPHRVYLICRRNNHGSGHRLLLESWIEGVLALAMGLVLQSRLTVETMLTICIDLNDDAFPLGTNGFPQTRGIRVEIAGIVIIFLFGLISQFKLWKLIKEQRDRKDATRMQHVENLERLESEVGRRVEDESNRERVRWEAVYGNKAGPSADSVMKPHVDVKEMDSATMTAESLEMSSVTRDGEKTRSSSHRASSDKRRFTITVGDEDGIQQIDDNGNPISAAASKRNSTATGNSGSRKASTDGSRSYFDERASLRVSQPPPPPMLALPFDPASGALSADKDTSSSTADLVQGDSRRGSKRSSGGAVIDPSESRRVSKRSSWMLDGIRRSLSERSRNGRKSVSQEDLVVPHDDDRASSIAATYDVLDGDQLSLSDIEQSHSQSDARSQVSETAEQKEARLSTIRPVSAQPSESGEPDVNSANAGPTYPAEARLKESIVSSTEHTTPSKSKGRRISKALSGSGEATPDVDDAKSTKTKSRPVSVHSAAAESFTGSIAEHLPEKLSKIALSYRTNEWAKHLEAAEKPVMEELKEPDSPGIQVDPSFVETVKAESQPRSQTVESAPPQNVVSVQANSPKEAPQLTRSSTAPQEPRTVQRPALGRSASSNTVQGSVALQKAAMKSDSNLINYRSSSASKLAARTSKRHSSGFSATALVESPIEEAPDSRRNSAFMPPQQETLLDKRESMMKRRVSTMSFNHSSSTPNVNVIAASTAGDITPRPGSALIVPQDNTRPLTSPVPDDDVDDIPLSQRRQQVIQAQRRLSGPLASPPATATSPPPQRQQMNRSTSATLPSLTLANNTFDSHQPKRQQSVDPSKQSQLLASWRASMAQELSAKAVKEEQVDGGRMQALLQERRVSEMQRVAKERMDKEGERMREAAMRDGRVRGGMMDAHREAMRKMQGEVPRNV